MSCWLACPCLIIAPILREKLTVWQGGNLTPQGKKKKKTFLVCFFSWLETYMQCFSLLIIPSLNWNSKNLKCKDLRVHAISLFKICCQKSWPDTNKTLTMFIFKTSLSCNQILNAWPIHVSDLGANFVSWQDNGWISSPTVTGKNTVIWEAF